MQQSSYSCFLSLETDILLKCSRVLIPVFFNWRLISYSLRPIKRYYFRYDAYKLQIIFDLRNANSILNIHLHCTNKLSIYISQDLEDNPFQQSTKLVHSICLLCHIKCYILSQNHHKEQVLLAGSQSLTQVFTPT